jgi:hypothetical protein
MFIESKKKEKHYNNKQGEKGKQTTLRESRKTYINIREIERENPIDIYINW